MDDPFEPVAKTRVHAAVRIPGSGIIGDYLFGIAHRLLSGKRTHGSEGSGEERSRIAGIPNI
jgi:hypothetical protein